MTNLTYTQQNVNAAFELAQNLDVRIRVLKALHWDLAVPRHRLNVEVADGWVTMSGQVDLPDQRSCAEFDARHVPGVVGVINHIRLASNEAERASAGQH